MLDRSKGKGSYYASGCYTGTCSPCDAARAVLVRFDRNFDGVCPFRSRPSDSSRFCRQRPPLRSRRACAVHACTGVPVHCCLLHSVFCCSRLVSNPAYRIARPLNPPTVLSNPPRFARIRGLLRRHYQSSYCPFKALAVLQSGCPPRCVGIESVCIFVVVAQCCAAVLLAVAPLGLLHPVVLVLQCCLWRRTCSDVQLALDVVRHLESVVAWRLITSVDRVRVREVCDGRHGDGEHSSAAHSGALPFLVW